eukprot:TRINITY_DN2277_c0_g1_i1.p1 TRINITY_DN2277_c0_g1~~TRINITY_DN2277_c0_g1_i1.p1  ORF type:complete len:496 (+),score=69.07 TRINITY_DN2277_c0_g1_i1:58-1488(+)
MIPPWALVKWTPKEFTETSAIGGVMSILTMVIVGIFSGYRVGEYWNPQIINLMEVDTEQHFPDIRFEVTFPEIECRNLKLSLRSEAQDDVVDLKWHAVAFEDYHSIQGSIALRTESGNRDDVSINETEQEHEEEMKQLERSDGRAELDADWSSSHDGFNHQSFDHVIKGHDLTLINFFASWCSHCRAFAPTWNKLADRVHGTTKENDNVSSALQPMTFPLADEGQKRLAVRLIKINCVDFASICAEKRVDAYPALRLYRSDGHFSLFKGKRSEDAIVQWITKTVASMSWKHTGSAWSTSNDHFKTGCKVAGMVNVARVPGCLEFVPRRGEGEQNLDPAMTNVSHNVTRFVFRHIITETKETDQGRFITERPHESVAHYYHVMRTKEFADHSDTLRTVQQHRMILGANDVVPQATFCFEFENMMLTQKKQQKRWYDVITATMALLGGVHAVMRLFSGASAIALSKTIWGWSNSLIVQ